MSEPWPVGLLFYCEITFYLGVHWNFIIQMYNLNNEIYIYICMYTCSISTTAALGKGTVLTVLGVSVVERSIYSKTVLSVIRKVTVIERLVVVCCWEVTLCTIITLYIQTP